MEKDKETKATEEREGSQVNQNVVDFGSAMTKTAHGTVYTLAIIGQIEGHTAAPNGMKTTQYEHMLPLLAKLEEKGYTFASAGVDMVPQTYVKLEKEEDIKNMEKLIDMLEENDDVQNVYHNWEQE